MFSLVSLSNFALPLSFFSFEKPELYEKSVLQAEIHRHQHHQLLGTTDLFPVV